MKKVLSFLVLTCCCSILFGQTSLQYRLSEGDTFTIKQKAVQVITQELDGAAHEITNNLDGVMQFLVMTENADNYQIKVTFTDLNLNMSSSIQGELLNVNASVVNEEDIQSKIFNSLLNEPIYIVLARNGDILEVTGGDSLVTKMANSSGLQDEFSLNMMKKSLEKEFGSEALSNSYKQMTFIYPDKKVAVGDEWENEYFGKLTAKNIWTLEELTADSADIIGNALVEMDIAEPATTMRLSGSQKTTISTDINTGFIQQMSVEGNFEGASTMAQLGDQEIPTSIKSTVLYELISNQVTEPIKY
ncbi:DUF6263 family protein [Muriicola sp. Z0-33]|uniref:DUF6263 family protein n=1 Tax=Muriicola sp. Z0-33 TaxID=2816957 RepID=UPI0022389839|nr:DUF6263 family protein [Muriicola sp. Z0-33]MCW5517065.1 hypothetical protein [Muriicola sp. Z0-33]